MATSPPSETAENGTTSVPESDPQTVTSETAIEGATTESDPSSEQPPPSSAPAPESADKKWQGWPGDNVYRLIVPVLKVGSIIGRKGELIKKMCEETRARIRILDGAIGTVDRIVLISGKEEPEAQISPAMDAVLRVFKRVTGLSEEGDGTGSAAAGVATCSVRLLAASSQAINLIGKQGSLIKSIQETTGASVRVLSGDEVPLYASSDERIVEIQGEPSKVLKALEAVVGHLRKFLVDHSIVPIFEKSYNTTITQDRTADTWASKPQSLPHPAQTGISNDYPLSLKRDSLFLDREIQLESQIQHSGLSLYGQDPGLTGLRSSGFGRATAPIVTQCIHCSFACSP
ncbi:hypothetical protein HHK36_013512 [Tetracentron sinense]|uniref:K Homology domain-containing protein n=1 Tax=Tetracentron sinense TaxID=13715 RepID=A0A834Z6F5_TETSI|nr:hypothetical protein HHK36_013512 [Tetracentron sinense]